jgi:hypothetical protein
MISLAALGQVHAVRSALGTLAFVDLVACIAGM